MENEKPSKIEEIVDKETIMRPIEKVGKIKKIFEKYAYWDRYLVNSLNCTPSFYSSCTHCGDSCHGDGECGGDGE
jgi:hypothetical protein